jgi:hypothetical protein
MLATADDSNVTVHNGFGIGAVRVRLSGSSDADVRLMPTLEPFCIDAAAFDIDLQIKWVRNIPQPEGCQMFDSGTTWRLHEAGAGLGFDVSSEMRGRSPFARLLTDRSFSSATLQMNEECFAGSPPVAPPLGYPLDELLIMHRLTQERGVELHGVGIAGPDGATNLFVGHSGAGKSTTARLWTSLHKVEILSDDRIIVRESPARELRPGDDPGQIFMYGTPWHGEGCFALPQRAPLQRIFVLEHGHGNRITRLTPSQAVGEFFARAFVPFHRHEYIDNAITFLEHLVASVPCYHYSFEPDERAVEKVLHFHD